MFGPTDILGFVARVSFFPFLLSRLPLEIFKLEYALSAQLIAFAEFLDRVVIDAQVGQFWSPNSDMLHKRHVDQLLHNNHPNRTYHNPLAVYKVSKWGNGR